MASAHIVLYVNGARRRLDAAGALDRTLLEHVRGAERLTGAKLGCGEGGCGACTVLVSRYDARARRVVHAPVNACLAPLAALDAAAVTTVEAVGRRGALAPVQAALASAHASQCGFCTPGIVMSCYAMLRSAAADRRSVTHADVEHAFDGNLCRCTGYRPILAALRALVDDAGGDPAAMAFRDPARVSAEGADLATNGCCKAPPAACGVENCCRLSKASACGNGTPSPASSASLPAEDALPSVAPQSKSRLQRPRRPNAPHDVIFPPELVTYDPPELNLGGRWLRPRTLERLLELRAAHPNARLVGGNTEIGIEARSWKPADVPPVYIAVTHVDELLDIKESDDGISVGASVTWTDFNAAALQADARFAADGVPWRAGSLRAIVKQLKLFAGAQVRAAGTIAGNIVTASPISDINPLWIAADAEFVLASAKAERRVVRARDFFLSYREVDMRPTEVMVAIRVPWNRTEFDYTQSFKTSRRKEDDIAIVSCGVRMRLEAPAARTAAVKGETTTEEDTVTGEDQWTIANVCVGIGGMAAKTVAVESVENVLTGAPFTLDSLRTALSVAQEELALPKNVPGGMPEFRQSLARGFLYKAFIQVGEMAHVVWKGMFSESPNLSSPRLTLDERLTRSLEHLEQERPLGSSAQFFSNNSTVEEPRNGLVHSSALNISEANTTTGRVGMSVSHVAAEMQVSGEATYIDDLPAQSPEELQGALVLSKTPHGRITRVDISVALSMPGVVDVVTIDDVKGNNMMGPTLVQDEFCFAGEAVTCVGQVIALVVADTLAAAKAGASCVHVEYEDLRPVLTIEEAIAAESAHPGAYLVTQHEIVVGDPEREIAVGPVVRGQIRIGAQEHFYLETNGSIVVPEENDEYVVFSSTQNASKTQKLVASVLGVPMHKIVCRVKRLGGGFGGKETRSIFISAAAAVAAQKTRRPVRLVLDRDVDMMTTGTRHAFLGKYECAYDAASGRIRGLNLSLSQNMGNTHDLSVPVLDRALHHAHNCYDIPNTRLTGYLYRTNAPSATAFRGFGGPQGMLVGETVLEHVAKAAQIHPRLVREANMYGMHGNGSTTSVGMKFDPAPLNQCWERVLQDSEYESAEEKVRTFNMKHSVAKRGIALVPTMFGISFTFKSFNQAAALVHVYSGDGSVLISHGGVEMGQGLHTKMCQVAATELRVPLSKVHVSETSTDKVPNASPTAASASTDMYGMAVLDACRQLRTRLDEVAKSMPEDATWEATVAKAWFERVDLSAHGFYKVPELDDVDLGQPGARGRPFFYYTNGAAVSVVEIDTLSGSHSVVSTHIVMDIGRSLNPAIDVGQIEGGFVQGLGWCTLEEVVRGSSTSHAWLKSGHMHTLGPGAYKIPGFTDIPVEFQVRVLDDIRNEKDTIHSSKAVGEPPLFLASSVYFAIRDAISAARADAGNDDWFELDSPATVERIQLLCPQVKTPGESELVDVVPDISL